MKNVSFDNPYLLLLLIPVAVLLTIPSIIAMVKGIKTKSVVISFIIHMVIAIAAVLALAGMKTETVITKTEIYVVADVSYSANKSLDKIDEYVNQVVKKAPKNSQIGLICFGKDQQVLTEMGGALVSVKNSTVDNSATNISNALNFTADKFSNDTIKRIVLITDGKETADNAEGKLISAIENLYAKNIYIDSVYIDSNLGENDRELQISDVQYTPSTYINHETSVNVAVEATHETKAIIHLYKNDELIESESVKLNKGYNIVNLKLDTAESGEFDYKVEISREEVEDSSPYNNSYIFTQKVASELKVLLVTATQEDVDKANALYGENATIKVVGSVNKEMLPCDIEELCQYDEIIISDIDLSTLENYDAFISSVEKAVSLFGKTLITMGDLKLQNTTNETLKKLENFLPVNFGNDSEDPKLFTIIIDISRSMQDSSQLIMAKQAAVQLMGLLSDEDYVCIVAFAGDAKVVQAPTKAVNRDTIEKEVIDKLQPAQGTFLGSALDETYKTINGLPYNEKQVMLISDGRSYTLEADNPINIVRQMKQSNIYTSVINVNSLQGVDLLKSIASYGGGKYYYAQTEKELDEIMFGKIADNITVSVVEESSPIVIKTANDKILEGIYGLPNIDGYVFASIKASATTVLTTKHEKSNGDISTPPIYAYWNHGNGKVCTFTSTLTGKWARSWTETDGEKMLSRIVSINTPDEKVDFPYNLNVEFDGINSTIEIIPAILNPYANVDAEIKLPNGELVTVSTVDDFIFDSEKYSYTFATPSLGKYEIKIIYSYDEKTFESNTNFNISYSPEFDSFAIFSPSALHAAIRNRGTVNEGQVPELINNDKETRTYVVKFTIPLLIIAVSLFVIDIMVRKLKWNDIKGLFKRTKKQGGTKVEKN